MFSTGGQRVNGTVLTLNAELERVTNDLATWDNQTHFAAVTPLLLTTAMGIDEIRITNGAISTFFSMPTSDLYVVNGSTVMPISFEDWANQARPDIGLQKEARHRHPHTQHLAQPPPSAEPYVLFLSAEL